MVIIKTKPVATIIQAVSAASIFGAAACAQADEAAKAALPAAANAKPRCVIFLILSPNFSRRCF
jgi:hypothetical protein